MRILIIEDEENIAKNIQTGLLDEGFSVDIAHTGNDGFDLASVEDYDTIVLDLMLPGMDGIEICRKLREENKRIPILMLTAKDSLEDKVFGLNIGADDYLVKPFSFEELLARIRSLIRRKYDNAPILKIKDLELNPSSHIVTRHGKEIGLTGKEYALLEYFMRHQNQILTREQILNHVWDYSYDSFSNIIEVFVRRIRQKIDKQFPHEPALLKTVRGLGYKITDK